MADCKKCMYDAPHDYCCQFECGEHEFCRGCDVDCNNGEKLCQEEFSPEDYKNIDESINKCIKKNSIDTGINIFDICDKVEEQKEDYCQLINFIPTNEYILYEALIHNGILPDDNRSKTWNDPNASIHKVWIEFENGLKEYNRRIIDFPHNIDGK